MCLSPHFYIMPTAMKTSPRSLLLAALGVAAIAGLLCVAPLQADSKDAKERAMPELRLDSTTAKRDATAPRSYSTIVKKAAPSVVYVFSSKTVKSPNPELLPFFNDPMFRRFFGDQLPDEDNGNNNGGSSRRYGQRRQPEMKQQGLGSGVIVSADGYILTNNHVVDGADEVKVTLDAGKREFVAEVVGRDPKADLAVLKIDAKGLTPIVIADSDTLEVGDTVLAIGNPFGIGQTVTSGIVSATGRSGLGIEEYEDFIQTDAAINPGNSGGALVNALGEVIGINTFILTGGGGSEGSIGLGFAVPVERARRIAQEIREHGRVREFGTGISTDPFTAQAMGVRPGDGVLVTQVKPGSAGAQAGVQAGDVIVGADGRRIGDLDDIRQLLRQFRVGDRVKIEVLRAGKTRTLWMVLTEGND